MSTPVEKIHEVLNNANPDDVRVTDRNGTIHVDIVLRQSRIEPGKWARFALEMQRKSPLKGKSELLNARIREFRDDFSFEKE